MYEGSNVCYSAVVKAMNVEEPCHVQQDTSLKNRDTDDFQEDMLQEIYDQATEVSVRSALFWSHEVRNYNLISESKAIHTKKQNFLVCVVQALSR